ncbi:MAG: hypothetical protein ACTFAK_13765 [Candidatus Electronema sp. VV]
MLFRTEAGDEAGGAERFDLGQADHADGMALFREKCGGVFPIDSVAASMQA